MAKISFPQSIVSAYNNFKTLTDTDATKQKVVQVVAVILMGNGTLLAFRGKISQSGICWTGAAVLWMNQEAFLHKALSENVGALSVHITDLDEALKTKSKQIEQMGHLISSMENLKTQGGQLLRDQLTELENLKKERDALKNQVTELDTIRKQIQTQVEALERTRKLFDAHIAQTSANINAALSNAGSPLKV